MEHKQYNLRSKKKECSIPIQLQLASDEDFMAALRPSTSGQVFESDHTDSSDSEIDVSDLINHSDQNLSDPVSRDAEAFPGGGQGPANQEVSNDSISQNDINRHIPQGTQAQQKLGSWEYIYLLSTKTFKITLLHTSLTLKKTL